MWIFSFIISSSILNLIFIKVSTSIWSWITIDGFNLILSGSIDINPSIEGILAFMLDNLEILLNLFTVPKFYLYIPIQIIIGICYLGCYYRGLCLVGEINFDRNPEEDKAFFVFSLINSLKIKLIILSILIVTVILFIFSIFKDISNLEMIVLLFSVFNIEITAGTIVAIALPEVLPRIIKPTKLERMNLGPRKRKR